MKKIIFLSLILISLPVTVACNSFSAASIVTNELIIPPVESVEIERIATVSNTVESVENNAAADSVLSEQEISDLLYMREEEKLAHDVYFYLYGKWGLTIFQNIAASEETHTSSILVLLNLYGISDPAAGLEVGQFKDANLQELYDQLVAQGSTSLVDAIKVGAAIEEIDILDLQEAGTYTSQPDIQQVYENLLQGSYNHLRAFTNSLRNQNGETYQPQFLSAIEYQTIMDGSIGSGFGNSGQGQPGRRGLGNPNRND